MHLKIQKRNGREYLSVVQSYRQNGAVKSRTIETIGYADAFADQFDDPIVHFKEYVSTLNEQNAAARQPVELRFKSDETIPAETAPTARLGASIALGYLDAIGVGNFFRTNSRRETSLILAESENASEQELAACSEIEQPTSQPEPNAEQPMNPPGLKSDRAIDTARDSSTGTQEDPLPETWSDPSKAGDPDGFPPHAGRVFEMLACERMMHAASKREAWTAHASFPRRCDFSFEDVYAALPCFARERKRLESCHFNRVRALAGDPDVDRIYLVCGSYAFPVDGGSIRASIAVALDRTGLPLGYHDMQGRLEPTSFREAADVLKERLGARKAVVIAGGLRNLQPTIDALAPSGDGFILYERDYDRIPELSTWANDENGYTPTSGGVHVKQRMTNRALPDGSHLPVREVALRGGGYAVRRNHAVLVSSELDMNAASIVNSYRELWRQAEPFQPLEADFSSVPYPTSASDHIRAHFSICYAAFLALRLLRWRMGWRHNAADTADALMRMEGAHLQRNYYLFSYRSSVTDDIERAAGIPAAQRLRTRGDLRLVPAATRRALSNAPI